MKICLLTDLPERLFGIDYHYSLINFNKIPIEQTGRFTSRKGERPWSRIMLITEGTAEFVFADKSFCAVAGDCVTIPGDSEFTLLWTKGGNDGCVCSYVMAFSLYDRQGDELVLSQTPSIISAEKNEYIRTLFCESVKEYSGRGSVGKLKCKSILLNLLNTLCDRKNHTNRDGFSRESNSISPALKLIDENFAADIDISTLTTLCHVSESTLRRAFISEKGMSPMKYLCKVRMAKAYDLLMQGGMSVSEVAASVNIPDISYFSRQFKSTFGISPAKIKYGMV